MPDDDWRRLQHALRQSEKRSRERRATRRQLMREQVEALVRVRFVLPLVDDADAVWDEFLDDEFRHTRDRVRRLLPACMAAQRLLDEKALLARLLQEHKLMIQAVRTVLGTEQARGTRLEDDWASNVQRWRALARIHFRPSTLEQCQRKIEQALCEVDGFTRSDDKQSSGLRFLGWQDSRRLDRATSRVQFQFHKVFRGYDVADYVRVAWGAYTDAKTYQDVIIGPHAQGVHDVLQQVTPDIVIIRGAERYPTLQVDAHIVYLVFRIPTIRGFTQCVRSIGCPEVERQINMPTDVWPSNFIWLRWELLDGDERGYRLHIGGAMGEIGMQYANKWMVDALGCVLRSEQLVTHRQLLASG